MAARKCSDCDAEIMWCEIETRNGIKKIPIDPKPTQEGNLTLKNVHRDLPLRAAAPTPADRRGGAPLYKSHRETCPNRDPNERYQERDPGWVREPPGY